MILPRQIQRKVDTGYLQLMFDWCRWQWNILGRYGVWDSDFRFELYSMGIITHTTTRARLSVDFDEALASNATSVRFFRECLHPTEQIQEITRAIKWAIDVNFAGDKVPPDDHDQIPEMQQMGYKIKNDSDRFCDENRRSLWIDFVNERPNVTKGLREKTNLCFKAIRPRDFDLLNYMNTSVAQSILTDQYILGYVCHIGKFHLQDWRVPRTRKCCSSFFNQDYCRKTELPVDLSDSLFHLEMIMMVILVAFLPMALLKFFPWDDNLRPSNNQTPINLVDERSRESFSAWKDIQRIHSYQGAHHRCPSTPSGEQPKCDLTIVASSANGNVLKTSNRAEDDDADSRGMSHSQNAPEEYCYLFSPIGDHTPGILSSISFFITKTDYSCNAYGGTVRLVLARAFLLLRRFLKHIAFVGHAIVAMVIVDLFYFSDVIMKLKSFRKANEENQVTNVTNVTNITIESLSAFLLECYYDT